MGVGVEIVLGAQLDKGYSVGEWVYGIPGKWHDVARSKQVGNTQSRFPIL